MKKITARITISKRTAGLILLTDGDGGGGDVDGFDSFTESEK